MWSNEECNLDARLKQNPEAKTKLWSNEGCNQDAHLKQDPEAKKRHSELRGTSASSFQISSAIRATMWPLQAALSSHRGAKLNTDLGPENATKGHYRRFQASFHI